MLLKEMQEMDRIVQQPVMGPKVNEVIQDTVNPVARPLDAGGDSSFAEVSVEDAFLGGFWDLFWTFMGI